MRQLHPVSFRERFVASGTYTFFQDAVPTGDVEHWTLHEPGRGAWTVRADHDGRAGSGTSWLFEGLYDGERRRFERFDLSLYGVQHTDAKFIFEPGEVQISLRVDGVAQEPLVVPLPEAYTLRLPALVADGLALSGDVESPAFRPSLDFAAGLVHGGVLETTTIAYYRIDPEIVPGKPIPEHGYAVRGDQGSDFTVQMNADKIPIFFQFASGLTAHLSQYVHRPEITP
jgi:hypothetical protein